MDIETIRTSGMNGIGTPDKVEFLGELTQEELETPDPVVLQEKELMEWMKEHLR